MDRLAEIFLRQRQLQRLVNGYELKDQDDTTRIENIKENVLACTDELHEALNEVGWKKWATTRHINEDNLRKEIIDAFHFIVNLALHAGMDANQFFTMFVTKNDQNYARQSIGYDGRVEKCPHCARALDDVGIDQGVILNETVFVCGHCAKTIPAEQIFGSNLMMQLVRNAKLASGKS